MGISLLTDLYELTMMQGYFFACREDEAVFDMFFRRHPFNGGYTIFAGLRPLLEALSSLRFAQEDIDYLSSLNIFHKEFLNYLSAFSFSGDVHAVEEGLPVFPYEPIVRVRGGLMEAQLIESLVLNIVNFQSLIATKASRVVGASEGRPVLEFGLRRAQGIDGALAASRASFIGGASATSNTLAGKIWGIPVSGTMAHSWVMNFPSEREAFEQYASVYRDRCVLLVDTYDTLRSGVPNAIRVFSTLKRHNPSLMAIRIDSGDLDAIARAARRMLDEAGLAEVKIYASSDLDEWMIQTLVSSGAPIDAFGVGTRMVTGWDDPALTGVYKVAAKKIEKMFHPRIKISDQSEKTTIPGVKNIIRFYHKDGAMTADLICLEEERAEIESLIRNGMPLTVYSDSDRGTVTLTDYSEARALLVPVMAHGGIIKEPEPLQAIRERCARGISSLSSSVRRISNPDIYPVYVSERLSHMKEELIHNR